MLYRLVSFPVTAQRSLPGVRHAVRGPTARRRGRPRIGAAAPPALPEPHRGDHGGVVRHRSGVAARPRSHARCIRLRPRVVGRPPGPCRAQLPHHLHRHASGLAAVLAARSRAADGGAREPHPGRRCRRVRPRGLEPEPPAARRRHVAQPVRHPRPSAGGTASARLSCLGPGHPPLPRRSRVDGRRAGVVPRHRAPCRRHARQHAPASGSAPIRGATALADRRHAAVGLRHDGHGRLPGVQPALVRLHGPDRGREPGQGLDARGESRRRPGGRGGMAARARER